MSNRFELSVKSSLAICSRTLWNKFSTTLKYSIGKQAQNIVKNNCNLAGILFGEVGFISVGQVGLKDQSHLFKCWSAQPLVVTTINTYLGYAKQCEYVIMEKNK